MEWKVAPSFANATIISVDEVTKKAIIESQCDRCGGSGQYMWGAMINNSPQFMGTCFKCNGVGRIRKRVKAYTPEELEKYLATQERAKERKIQKRNAEAAALQEQSEDNKKAYLEERGYDTEHPQLYIVEGKNTYAIKDQLKESGCRFEKPFGWYSVSPIDVPEGYYIIAVPFDDVYDWDCQRKKAFIKEGAADKIEVLKAEHRPVSKSEYIGNEKERLRDLEVVFLDAHPIESAYGMSIIYTFKQNENIIVWFCSGKGLDASIHEGDIVLLTGTVKTHKEYNGEKQTYVSRCKVVKEG